MFVYVNVVVVINFLVVIANLEIQIALTKKIVIVGYVNIEIINILKNKLFHASLI